jgi:hypothetical protein
MSGTSIALEVELYLARAVVLVGGILQTFAM